MKAIDKSIIEIRLRYIVFYVEQGECKESIIENENEAYSFAGFKNGSIAPIYL